MELGFYNRDCIGAMAEMPDNSVDLTLTDIPYDGVNLSRPGGHIREVHKGEADIITFDLEKFLAEVYRVTKGTMIIFCGCGQVSTIYRWFIQQQATVRQLIWEKTNPSPMNGDNVYLSGIENAVWARKVGGVERLMRFARTQFYAILQANQICTRQKRIIA